jgi:hypothetical protein
MKINFKFYVICFFLFPSKIIGQHLSLDDLIKFQKQTVVEINNTLLPKGWFFAESEPETDTTYGVSIWDYPDQYSSNLVTGSLNYKFARNVSNRIEYFSSSKTTFSKIQEKIKSFGMILFNSFTGDNYIISDYRGKNYILRITFYSKTNQTIYKYELFERSDFENDNSIENKFVDKSIYTGKYLICTSILNVKQNHLMEEASSFSKYFYRIPLNSKVYILEDSDDIFDKHYKVYVDGYIGFVHSGYLKDEPLKKEISGQKYRISNNCDYSDDLKMICIYWIDGVIYNHKSEITLNNGKHIIKNYLKDKIDGYEFNDEKSLYIDENTPPEIIIGLNCACPFFYYKNNSGYFFGGELIRNLNSIDKEGLDFMKINKEFLTSDTLILTIKEEKEEISYLDEIYLNINDSIKLFATSDDTSINANILLRDGKYEILKKGDEFDIYFIIPKSIFLESVKIYSYGYYLNIEN